MPFEWYFQVIFLSFLKQSYKENLCRMWPISFEDTVCSIVNVYLKHSLNNWASGKRFISIWTNMLSVSIGYAFIKTLTAPLAFISRNPKTRFTAKVTILIFKDIFSFHFNAIFLYACYFIICHFKSALEMDGI